MKNWYEHPAVLKSWLAEKLYGDRSRTNTGTLARKMKSGKWSAAELEKLEAARTELEVFITSFGHG
ncbi:MAG TPA: hypothetical protein PKE69_27705 [Pyrinomonadaceae bacterium]|nr:hypothetical protein [Pyrinomonadaceae bacterium]